MKDRKIVDYKVFAPNGYFTFDEFSLNIKKEIENGWVPLGPPIILACGYKFLFSKLTFVKFANSVYQAMVKYEDEK